MQALGLAQLKVLPRWARSQTQARLLIRFYLVVAVLAVFAILLVGRILSLQIIDTERGYEFLQDQGDMRSVRTTEIPAYRGVITDRRVSRWR